MDSDRYILFLSLITLLFVPTPVTATKCKSNITAIFAFGDSILDPGNNNALRTICRSNHRPYGIDLQGRAPSGRFTNGKLPVDFVISTLGIKKLLPAYLDPAITDEALLTGASFASACSGLDDLTAATAGALPLTAQLRKFQEAFDRIRGIVGQKKAGRIIGKSLFIVGTGTSDMMNNFYTALPMGAMSSLSDYHDLLLRNLETVIKRLVSLGAVRLAVMGMPPVGCLPVQVTVNSMNAEGIIKRECFAERNQDSEAYNQKLQSLITRLQTTLSRSRVVYADIYNPIMDMIHNPANFGFKRTLEGCCGSGAVEMGPLCNAFSPMCQNPSEFLFWDAAHPTQAAYKIIAKQFQDKVLPKLTS